jgi:hypothetical protein
MHVYDKEICVACSTHIWLIRSIFFGDLYLTNHPLNVAVDVVSRSILLSLSQTLSFFPVYSST